MRKLLLISLLFFLSAILTAQTYQELTEEALRCVQNDSLVKAELLLKDAMKIDPGNISNLSLLNNLGVIQMQLGRTDDALQSYAEALKYDPDYIPVLESRAGLYMIQGLTDKAYYDYCRILDNDKNNITALSMRAYLYMLKRDYNAARIDYVHLLKVDPQHYSGKLGLVNLNKKEKRYQDAIRLLDVMLIDYPDNPEIFVTRASVQVEMGLTDMALLDVDKAIQINNTIPEAFILRGEIYLSKNKKSSAKKDFEQAITLGIPASDMMELIKLCR